jgi:hypothetical protein
MGKAGVNIFSWLGKADGLQSLQMPELDLAINMGLRQGSQYSQTWDMVDFRGRMLNIPRTKNPYTSHQMKLRLPPLGLCLAVRNYSLFQRFRISAKPSVNTGFLIVFPNATESPKLNLQVDAKLVGHGRLTTQPEESSCHSIRGLSRCPQAFPNFSLLSLTLSWGSLSVAM